MAAMRGTGATRVSKDPSAGPSAGGRDAAPSEQGLVAKAAGGDEQAFETLVARHRETLYNVALRALGDGSAAEDVTQEALIRLHAALPGFRGDAQIRTWLFRITLNLCHDHGRRLRRRGAELRLMESKDHLAMAVWEDPDASLDVRRARSAVEAAVQRLPQEQKEAVLLRFMAELSYAEIAEVTGVPPGTVASRVFRALRKLGADMDPWHAEAVR